MWLLLLLFSCTENEQAVEPVNPGEVRMSMNISTRAMNDSEVLNANETRISRLRIYVFDGTSLDKMYYWQGLTATDGTYTTPVFTVKAATGKTLYAIVNEPVDTNARAILESVDHPNDLIDVQYQMADYLTTKTNVAEYTKEYCLPMYGELAGVDAAEGTTQTVNMHVDRAVARVDIYMRKESGNREEVEIPTTLIVTGVSKTGFISPEKIGNYASSAINILSRKTVGEIPEETSPEDKGVLAYSFYIPEMECRDSKLNIGIDEYDMIELGGDANNSGGVPLEKLERNHVYQLLCRFMRKTSILDINLTVCPWESLPPQIEEVKGEVKMTNCYMVAPGGRVDISTENVYKIWAQQAEFGNIPIPDGDVTAELVWQDEQGVIADGGITVVNASEREKAYLQIRTAKEGNAVVAMKVNDEIYWSWHIWCTDYEPNVTEGQQNFKGYIWMDRNLGAAYNSYHEEGGVRTKGLVYQWGRKDPFLPAIGWENNEPDQPLYNGRGEAVTLSREVVSEVNNFPSSVHHPLTFYASPTSSLWYSSQAAQANSFLWNSQSGEKTPFDPCPAGWRVPVSSNVTPWYIRGGLADFLRHYDRKGLGFESDKTIYYPCSGVRDYVSGDWEKTYDYSAVYWTGVAMLNDVICLSSEFSTGSARGGTNTLKEQASAGSVRCVKE